MLAKMTYLHHGIQNRAEASITQSFIVRKVKTFSFHKIPQCLPGRISTGQIYLNVSVLESKSLTWLYVILHALISLLHLSLGSLAIMIVSLGTSGVMGAVRTRRN